MFCDLTNIFVESTLKWHCIGHGVIHSLIHSKPNGIFFIADTLLDTRDRQEDNALSLSHKQS